MLRVGPFRKPSLDRREYVKSLLLATPQRSYQPSVACIYVSQGRGEALYMAFVNKAKPMHILRLWKPLSLSSQQDGVLRAHDVVPEKAVNSQKGSRIKDFLLQNRPDLIVLNSSGGFASKSTHMLIEKNLIGEVQRELELQAEQRRAERPPELSDEDEDEDERSHYFANVTYDLLRDDDDDST
jgi:hypothetical protein